MRLRALAAEVGHRAAIGLQTAAHHNQIGIAAGWVNKYMSGPSRSLATPEQDLQALFNVAGQYLGLQNALVEVRAGVRTFEAAGSLVRLAYDGNHPVDALDRLFDLLQTLDALGAPPVGLNPRLREWISTGGLNQTWDQAPEWVRDEYRAMASGVLASYARYLDERVTVAGFTIRDFDAFWVELLAWGNHMHAATLLGSERPMTVAPLVARDSFVAQLASGAGIPEGAVDRMTTVLTLDLERCPDGALTPLVEIDTNLVPMSGLIVPSAPHRNLIAILQRDPCTVGEIGRLLGAAGERETVDVIARLHKGTLVGRRVKVTRRNGESAGDLDVVVCDPGDRLLAVFEIKWHIAADGNEEVYRAEASVRAKREQAIRLRREMHTGDATPEWPPDWPDVSEFRQRWFVLTRDVLPMRDIDEGGVTARSVQLLQRMLRADASVVDLVQLLDDPPTPPEDLCATQWERVRYGDLRVEVELIVA